MAIELQNVCKAFGEKQVLQDFSHTFPEGELTCVMGPSGCGKTTLLSLLLGLEQPDAGKSWAWRGEGNPPCSKRTGCARTPAPCPTSAW